MYKLVRNFSIASAVAIVVATTVLGFVLHQNLKNELVITTEQQNTTLARSYANTLGARLPQFLDDVAGMDTATLVASAEFRDLDGYFRRVAAGVNVLKIKAYRLDGRTVYASDRSEERRVGKRWRLGWSREG